MTPSRENVIVFGELGVADEPRWVPGQVFSQAEISPLLRVAEEPSPDQVKNQPLFKASSEPNNGFKFDLSRKVSILKCTTN